MNNVVKNFSIKNAKEFEQNWTEIRNAIKEVFQLVTDFGYVPNTLTSLNALLPIVYYLYKTDRVKEFCQKVCFIVMPLQFHYYSNYFIVHMIDYIQSYF